MHRFVVGGRAMARAGLGAALLMVVLMASTSGCMGLISAREAVEFLREPAYEDLNNKKITVNHAFENIDDYLTEYTNRSTFTVDDQTNEINVYFKVSFEASRNLPSVLLDNESHYVRATLTDAEGMVQGEQDVSEDASPLEETLLPNPSFAHGECELDIQARGGGESTFGSIQVNFVIIVTVINSCIQYPLVDECY